MRRGGEFTTPLWPGSTMSTIMFRVTCARDRYGIAPDPYVKLIGISLIRRQVARRDRRRRSARRRGHSGAILLPSP
jgi:hypothetical protein